MYTSPSEWDVLITPSIAVMEFAKKVLGFEGRIICGAGTVGCVKGKSVALVEGESGFPLSFAAAAMEVSVLRFDPPISPYEPVNLTELAKRFTGIKTYSVYDMDEEDEYGPLSEDDDALLAEAAEDPFFSDIPDMGMQDLSRLSSEEFRQLMEDEVPEPLPSVRSRERRSKFHRDPDLDELTRRADMLSELESETGQTERMDI